MKRTIAIILSVLFIFLAGCSYKGDTDNTNKQETEKVVVAKDSAKDFKLKDIEGKEIKLSDYKGKVIILNFFATWCPPCRAEFPGFIQMVDEYKNNTDVEFVFVNLGEDKDTVIKFLNERNYNIKPLLDLQTDVAALYGVTGIPTTVIIDKEFKIDTIHVGFMEKGDLKNHIENLK